MAIEALIVCPVCRGSLRGTDALSCSHCRRRYPYQDGIPDLTPRPSPDSSIEEQWSSWEQLQDNGANAYRTEPASNLSVGDRPDIARFAEYSEQDGVVLDVGCGPQVRPSYARTERFVGIDPLRGERNREFDFVMGIGEYLPFSDKSFDHVLFVTSLDHLLDPAGALREAARVLVAGGTIEILTGEVSQPQTKAASVRNGFRLLRRGHMREFIHGLNAHLRPIGAAAPMYPIPLGAADAFHLFHPTRGLIDRLIGAAGLRVIDSTIPEPGQRYVRVVANEVQ